MSKEKVFRSDVGYPFAVYYNATGQSVDYKSEEHEIVTPQDMGVSVRYFTDGANSQGPRYFVTYTFPDGKKKTERR